MANKTRAYKNVTTQCSRNFKTSIVIVDILPYHLMENIAFAGMFEDQIRKRHFQ